STAAAHIAPADLAGFFAETGLAFNVLSLLMQWFVVGWLMRAQGIDRVLSVLPAWLATGAAAVLVAGGLPGALALKSGAGALRYSLDRTVSELLFVPLPASLRGRVKGLIDALGQRGGQAAASVLILGALALHSRLALVVGIIALALGWIVVARRLKR